MEKGFKQFLIKAGVFVILFILFSLIIGQKIVSSALLNDFGIFIYGGMGYILLFSIIGFILFYRERFDFVEKRYDIKEAFFLAISLILVSLFYMLELNISFVEANILNIILVHLLFLSIFAFLILGVFGWNTIKDFIKKFKKELFYFIIFGIIVYLLMNIVWSLWPYLSDIVMKVVSFLLKIISNNVSIINSNTLIFEGFAAQIAEACSGIYSIFIFSSLYLFGVLLDWKKLNKAKAILIFVPAVLGAFFVNILRVFLLFIAGAYISRGLALGLYHSYVGMIFFLIYFGLFWSLAYKWMKKDFKGKKSLNTK